MSDEKLIITTKRLKGEDGYRTLSIRVREEIIEGIDKIAEQTGRSRNSLIGKFLSFALKHCVVEGAEE